MRPLQNTAPRRVSNTRDKKKTQKKGNMAVEDSPKLSTPTAQDTLNVIDPEMLVAFKGARAGGRYRGVAVVEGVT